MRILFVSNLLPFPLNNGGKIKTYHTLKALSKNNHVDFVSFINSNEEKKYIEQLGEIVNSVKVIKKTVIRKTSTFSFITSLVSSLVTNYPYVIYKFWDKRMKKLLEELQQENNYDYVYVDHLPMMIYQKYYQSPIILDQHNVESLIIKRFVEQGSFSPSKIYGYLEYKKLYKFEKEMIKRANKTIALSEQDKNEFERMSNSKNIYVVPICIETNFKKVNVPSRETKDPIKLLFVGTMSWFPNYQGITWFIKNVFWELDPMDFELYIIGGNPPNELITFGKRENIHVLGYVDDVNKFIKKCDISIVPIFVGSGIRVKIIESFAKGIPTLSTDIGAEGINVKRNYNILIANTKEEFLRKLYEIKHNIIDLQMIALEGYKTYQENYSLEILNNNINKILNMVENNEKNS